MFRFKLLPLLESLLAAMSLLFAASPATFAATRITEHTNVAAASINGCPPTVSNGSSGTWVAVLQYRLNFLYHYSDFPNSPHNFSPPLSTDGSFGSLTTAAVEDFQSNYGLSVDGSVGPQTWSTLGFCTGSNLIIDGRGVSGNFTSCPPTENPGANNTWVDAIQARLNIFYMAELFPDYPYEFSPYLTMDGGFGSLTTNAVEDFQSNFGLSVDGSVGPQTWSKLNLC